MISLSDTIMSMGKHKKTYEAIFKDPVFHRPHPAKETDRGAVRSMRRFLQEAGVTHDEL
jgi:hypothetical protein